MSYSRFKSHLLCRLRSFARGIVVARAVIWIGISPSGMRWVLLRNSRQSGYLNADAILVLVTLLAAAGWGFSFQALKGMPPLLFIGVRFTVAGILVALVGISRIRQTNTAELLRAGAATGSVFGLAMVLWVLGLHYAENMGVGSFICSLGVVLAPVVGWALFRVHIGTSTWIAVVVASAGMACLSLHGNLRLSVSDLFFVGFAAASSIHFNLISRYVGRVSSLPLTAIQLFGAGVIALLVSLSLEPWPASIGQTTISWVAASILIATCLRFFLQVKGQSMASVSHAALIMTLEPIWVALLGMVWLGERMSGVQIGGCALILLALLINRWRWLFGK